MTHGKRQALRGKGGSRDPLDQRCGGDEGLTYREINEIYVEMGTETRIVDGAEITLHHNAPLFVVKEDPLAVDPLVEAFRAANARLKQRVAERIASLDAGGIKAGEL